MAPRKLKAHRQGCWIEATGSGLLRLRFRWRLPTATGLHKFSETTTLRDTAENRATLSKQAAVIGAEIAADRFDYLRWFPNGSRAIHFRPTPHSSDWAQPDARPTIGQFYPAWVARRVPPIVRPSRARDYRNHFRTYILPYLADVALQDLSLVHLEELRARLQIDRHLGLKTVRNVIDGSLRAMVRDARKAGVQAGFPFADLEWPAALFRVLIHSRKMSATDCSNSFFASIGVLGEILVPTAKASTSPITRFSSRSSIRVFVPPKLSRFASGLSISPQEHCSSSGRAH